LGAFARAKKLATETKGKVNVAIIALREADPTFLAACDDQERLLASHGSQAGNVALRAAID
jgi:hypothetical protein